jgi:cobalt/nickel transport system permease protein
MELINMANITQTYYKMFILDELADRKTAIHGINPAIKLIVTLIFIIIVVSYGKYNLSGLIPLFFYPVILMSVGDIPYKPMLVGLAIASPLVIGAGIFNPILDRTIVLTLWGAAISSGMLSFASLILKCALTVLAALLLLATTGIGNIAAAMQKLHIPDVFIMQLLLTYRYISVLMGETGRVYNAYTLRATYQKGVSSKVWGSLLGLLLLRTFDRAVRLYQAMKLRGYGNNYYGANLERIKRKDILYLFGWTIFFLTARIINLPMLMGLLVTRLI